MHLVKYTSFILTKKGEWRRLNCYHAGIRKMKKTILHTFKSHDQRIIMYSNTNYDVIK